MPARTLVRALAVMLAIGALPVVLLWSVRDQDARAEEHPHSGIPEGQENYANDHWTDPLTMHEAYAMGSPCFGCPQAFWNTVVNR